MTVEIFLIKIDAKKLLIVVFSVARRTTGNIDSRKNKERFHCCRKEKLPVVYYQFQFDG